MAEREVFPLGGHVEPFQASPLKKSGAFPWRGARTTIRRCAARANTAVARYGLASLSIIGLAAIFLIQIANVASGPLRFTHVAAERDSLPADW